MTVHTAVFHLTAVFILIPLFTCTSTCSNKCYFLLNDQSGNKSRTEDFTVDVPPDRQVTGIITIDGEFKKNNSRFIKMDTLRFSKTDGSGENSDPLVLAIDVWYQTEDVRDVIDKNQLTAWGVKATFPNIEKENSEKVFDRPPYKFKIFPSTEINIQISDMNVTTDQFYEFYVGPPGESEYWPFNYRSSAMLQRFAEAGITLNSTSIIQNKDPSNLTVYSFISVCSDPQPVLCDSPEEIIDVVLGAKYTLTCSGSGAPYLSSRWDRDTYKPTLEEAAVTVINETADNSIESTILIESFTVDHIGTWTCTIFNKNFQGYSVQKKYVLRYSESASLITHPLTETYSPEEGNSTFVWKMEGWTLEQIHLRCDIGLAGTHEIVRQPQFYTKVPPRLTITLTLTAATTQGLINCQLLNQDTIMDERNITKVGNGCEPGQYGADKSCYNCPRGETSPGGGPRCRPVSNSCYQDQFGVGEDCSNCPWGTVTFLNDIAAKKDDCRNVSRTSQCPNGAYGYGDTCRPCPPTMTSVKGAVKVSDCFKVTTFCGELNHWGTKNNCTPCPDQHTSGEEAVKPQDCLQIAIVEKTDDRSWVLITGIILILIAVVVIAYCAWKAQRRSNRYRYRRRGSEVLESATLDPVVSEIGDLYLLKAEAGLLGFTMYSGGKMCGDQEIVDQESGHKLVDPRTFECESDPDTMDYSAVAGF